LDKTATAVVFEKPGMMAMRSVGLVNPTAEDCVVEVLFSGISTGTERLLWDGTMPPFPGLDYPLVPGYESVGRVVEAGAGTSFSSGDLVFVPGSPGYTDVRGLFGAAAERVIVNGDRLLALDESIGVQGVLLALAATAHHIAGAAAPQQLPDLIVGHGVLGRLLARVVIALGGAPPTVWERDPQRSGGAAGYAVIDPDEDDRRDYRAVADVSGDASLLNTLIGRIGHGGRVILGGFYHEPVSFAFPPAFQREAEIKIAAEWQRPDLVATLDLVRNESLSLDGLITHQQSARAAAPAYRTAFGDPQCLKMVLDWRSDTP
jgi:3-hydroxyethyl bacteriochlorophyllide a dehydrogenase